LRFALPVLAAVFFTVACKKKFEIIPEGAKQVSREDKAEADVSLREYKFTLNNEIFLCESRDFPEAAKATEAARKAIAERPQEEQKTGNAHFALSGRSIWLRTGKQLVWCMLTTSGGERIGAAMLPVRELFLKKFKEV